MDKLKFRQAIFFNGKFHSFHYWGFISEENFTAPQCGNQEALKNSQQYTGKFDKNKNELCLGDIVKLTEEIKFCPKCEHETSVLDKFCSKCGYEITEKDKVSICKVEQKDGSFHLSWNPCDEYYQTSHLSNGWLKEEMIEIIGNEFENPNLLN